MLDAHTMTVDDILAIAGLSAEHCESAMRAYFKQTPLTRMQDRAELMLTAVTSEDDFYQSYGSLMATSHGTGLGGLAPLGAAYDGMLCTLD